MMAQFSTSIAQSETSPLPLAWRRAYVLIAMLLVGILIGFSAMPVANMGRKPQNNKDYSLWYDTGRLVLSGGDLYPVPKVDEWGNREEGELEFPYMYPPFPAIFVLAPLSFLGRLPMAVALNLLNGLAMFTCVFLCVYLVTGRLWRQHPLFYLLPVACVVPYVWDTFFLGQVNLLLLMLMLLMFVALRRKLPWLAGAILGLATAIKAFPILAAGYLVWRRQFKALAALIGTIVLLLVLLPAPIRGFERNWQELTRWAQGMLMSDSSQRIAQRQDIGFTYRNQSLMALVHRLTRPLAAGERSDGTLFSVNFVSLSPWQSQSIHYASALLLVIGVGWLLIRGRRAVNRLRLLQDGQSEAMILSLEASLVLLMVVLFSPLAWTYYYCWLMLPLAALLGFIDRSPLRSAHRVAALVLGGIVLLVLGSAITQNFDQTLQAYGVTAIGSLILLATLGWALWYETQAAMNLGLSVVPMPESSDKSNAHRPAACPSAASTLG